jgi:hypothetical protein
VSTDHGSVEVSHEAVNPLRRSRPDPVEQTPTVGTQFAEPIGNGKTYRSLSKVAFATLAADKPKYGSRRPKNLGPFQREPVMVPATRTASTDPKQGSRPQPGPQRTGLVVPTFTAVPPTTVYRAQAARRRDRRESERAPPPWTMR